MSRLDFHFEVDNDIPQLEEMNILAEAEDQLRALAKDQSDMIGASIAIDRVAEDETVHLYQARVIAYIKPDNLAATEKADTPEAALRNAVDAVERQVRKRRDKFHKPWKTTQEGMTSVYQLNAREIYDAYSEQRGPLDLLDKGRTSIATQLMASEGLDREAAFHAADQMLAFAQELVESPPHESEKEPEKVITYQSEN